MENKMKSKVSVVIPLYNQKRYLNACVDSICKQSYKNLEIIIVNDGSTDDSSERAKALAKNDARIKVFDKQNEGTSYARRDGYLQSTGDYITFVDNDDMLPTDAIEHMVTCMETKDTDLVLGGVTRILGFLSKKSALGSFPIDEVVSNPRLFDEYYIGFFRNTVFPINIWGRLYRKSVIDEAYKNTELFSAEMPCMAGDEYFNLKLFPFLRSMYRTDKVVYLYRIGGTVDYYNRFFPETFVLSDKRLALLDKYGYVNGYQPLYVEYINMVYYHAQQMLQFKQGDRDDVIAFFKKELNRRSIVSRMTEYFEQNKSDDVGIRLMLNRDYDGMYEHALQLMHQRCNKLSYKTKRLVMALIDKLS